MATFPQLKTGAVAQYPIARQEKFRTQTVRFLDGSDQRFRDLGGTAKRWIVQLRQVDESELAAIEEFFIQNQGAYGSFAFTDPWDGNVYDDCSLEADELSATTAEEMRCMTQLVVVRNR
jgi:phage-related protein